LVRFISFPKIFAGLYLSARGCKGWQKTKKLGDFHSFAYSNSNLQNNTAEGVFILQMRLVQAVDYYYFF